MTEAAELLDDVHQALELPSDRRLVTAAELARELPKGAGLRHVVGVEGAGAAWMARALAAAGPEPVVLITPDADTALKLVSDLECLTAPLPLPGSRGAAVPGAILALSAPEASPYAEVQPDRRAQMLRLATLSALATGAPWRFLVVAAPALMRRVPAPSVVRDATVRLVKEAEIDVTALARRLAASGYLRVPVVEDPGSFAVRGGLFDVWAPGQAQPVRVELYGDLIASVKRFDPDDQRSGEELAELWLSPVRDAIVTEASEARARAALRDLCDAVDWPSSKARQLIDDVATGRAVFGADQYLPAFGPLASVLDYVPEAARVVVEEPARVVAELRAELERGRASRAEAGERPHYEVEALFVADEALGSDLARRNVLAAHRTGVSGGAATGLDALETPPEDAPSLALRDHADLARAVKLARSELGKSGALNPLARRLEAWREAGLVVVIAARVATQAERLAALLGHRGLRVLVVEPGDPGAAEEPREVVRVVVGPLARGAIVATEGLVLVTEEEIFGQRAHRAPVRKRSPRAALEDLRALAPGDHVVHVDHGIGRYLGLERRSVGGVHVELLAVEYAGGDKLYLPVYRLNQIQKHSGGEGSPKLDRLGGQSFAKTKQKVQKRVRQMADELLRLYAERAALKKEPLPAADDDYATFEATFPFEETRDQAQAIGEVLTDMQSPRVMDRLVCGDVGFGKTEVALRAAFRTALAGRQVALLCPTTVLAQQHYNNFKQRFADWPLSVAAMSRFETAKEQAETLKGLKDGSVDVVIGTHRLLSKDVHFKRLGLLVVDEEQRFGVTHKERIKQIRASVDALTLSATPIPRTLQMAVSGLRDMSLITTAPVDRRAIRTITSRWDDHLVREAVERELARGGQVFYVFNRVEGIYERAAKLQQLVPSAKIAVGHGQLTEALLEKTMTDFVEGEYDVLVATAIIESGLDIPRANTIIVDRADLFGLSQLYQIRGRVGRSSERAYCYLLVPPASQLSDEARARIEAMERFTELGSGFQVATLDMELRGAGDLLGAEQSGFAASVGFELFCRVLEEATHELRGEPVVHAVDPELSFDVEALLPEDYVSEVGVRLSLYKRLAGAADEHEVAEIASEMEDRFGAAPPEARRLVELMRLKTELRRLRVLGIEASARAVTLHLRDDTPLDPSKIGALLGKKKSPWKLSPDGRLTRRADEGDSFVDGIALADRMLSELDEAAQG